MKPKILFCTQTAHLLGGFQVWLDRLCELLPALGWDVVVGFAKGAKFHDPARFRNVYRHMQGVDIDGRDGTVEGRLLAVERVIESVKPDIVSPALLADANLAVARSKLKGSPVRLVYTIHGTHDWNIAEPERYAEFIDLCGGCNVLAIETLRKRGRFVDERLAAIPNGLPSRPPPEQRPLNADQINLAFVGRIEHPDKRVLDIPGILDGLEQRGVPFQFRIAGSGPQDEELKSRLSRQIAAGKVQHFGRLHFDEVHDKVYSKTDVLLFPSPWEGWPLVVGEAISAGCVPATAAFRGVAKERMLMPDHNAVMYQVGDAPQAADRIAELHHHPEKLIRMSNNAYATSLEYTWQRCAGAWSDAMYRTLERPAVCGAKLPDRTNGQKSRLTSIGVPVKVQVALRKLLQRQYAHDSITAEWPMRDTDFPTEGLLQMEQDLLSIEQEAIFGWPVPFRSIRSLTRAESQ